jgi:hypothetical protein
LNVIDYISAHDVANQASMLRTTYDGPIMVVEGITDLRLYGKYTDGECEIIIAHSKDNVRIAVKELSTKRKDTRILGIMDADIDRLVRTEPKAPLFLTDARDAEMMILSSNSLNDVLWEYGEKDKVEAFVEKYGEIRQAVLEASYPIGLLMYLSYIHDLGLSFKDLDFSLFVDPLDLTLSGKKMIDEIIFRSKNPSAGAKSIRTILEDELDNERDPLDVCRGHDAVEILVLGLRRTFGGFNARGIRPGELAGALRLAFTFEDFMQTKLYKKTKEWADAARITLWAVPDLP